MKKLFVAATAAVALAASASAASATTFTGSYSTSYQQSDPGLVLQVSDLTPGAGTGFSFDLAGQGSTAQVNLFHLWTNEASVDGDDFATKPITVAFNFTAPSTFGGSVSGDTGGAWGLVLFKGFYQDGYVNWDNNGNTLLNFGNGGELLVHLDDAIFNKGGTSLFNSHLNPGETGAATITADFTLMKSPVPEPMSWALMLTGFFGMGASMRASRRQRGLFTVA